MLKIRQNKDSEKYFENISIGGHPFFIQACLLNRDRDFISFNSKKNHYKFG